MPMLFRPMHLRSLEIRNRIFMPPMCQYSAVDGVAGEWHRIHYGSRAVGGLGLIVVEATAVCPDGRISPADLGLWNDAQAEALAPLAAFMRERGVVSAIQLAHAGRKASAGLGWQGGLPLPAEEGGWPVVGPSALPWAEDWPVPHALNVGEMDAICASFVQAAHRALASGFQVVEIHAAHGYLLHEFLSPLTNFRGDDYGGSLENRMRFPLRVAAAVREVWPQTLPVFARISATDWVEGGWSVAEAIVFSRELARLGVDLIDCSSGGLVPTAQVLTGPGYQVEFAEAVRREVGVATAAVGEITAAAQAEQILRTGQADAVMLGRELLRNPYWALFAASELGAEGGWSPQYQRAAPPPRG